MKTCSKCKEKKESKPKYISEYPIGSEERIKEQKQRWYLANKEKAQESVKKYRLNNPEKAREYYSKNKDKILEYYKDYRISKKDLCDASKKRWKDNNLERLKEYAKEYSNHNKDKYAFASVKYLYKKEGLVLPSELIETIVLINKTKQLCRTLNN